MEKEGELGIQDIKMNEKKVVLLGHRITLPLFFREGDVSRDMFTLLRREPLPGNGRYPASSAFWLLFFSFLFFVRLTRMSGPLTIQVSLSYFL